MNFQKYFLVFSKSLFCFDNKTLIEHELCDYSEKGYMRATWGYILWLKQNEGNPMNFQKYFLDFFGFVLEFSKSLLFRQ